MPSQRPMMQDTTNSTGQVIWPADPDKHGRARLLSGPVSTDRVDLVCSSVNSTGESASVMCAVILGHKTLQSSRVFHIRRELMCPPVFGWVLSDGEPDWDLKSRIYWLLIFSQYLHNQADTVFRRARITFGMPKRNIRPYPSFAKYDLAIIHVTDLKGPTGLGISEQGGGFISVMPLSSPCCSGGGTVDCGGGPPPFIGPGVPSETANRRHELNLHV